jgi:hypothetical protein
MAQNHTKQYEKLLQAVKDPSNKSDLHNDPDVGHIVKKLSATDFQALRDIANGQSKDDCCPPSVGTT